MEVSLKVLSTWYHSTIQWKSMLNTLSLNTISRFIFRGPILLFTTVHLKFWAVLDSKFLTVREF